MQPLYLAHALLVRLSLPTLACAESPTRDATLSGSPRFTIKCKNSADVGEISSRSEGNSPKKGRGGEFEDVASERGRGDIAKYNLVKAGLTAAHAEGLRNGRAGFMAALNPNERSLFPFLPLSLFPLLLPIFPRPLAVERMRYFCEVTSTRNATVARKVARVLELFLRSRGPTKRRRFRRIVRRRRRSLIRVILRQVSHPPFEFGESYDKTRGTFISAREKRYESIEHDCSPLKTHK